MNQESNNSNRFIFSNDFYNSLVNNEENKNVVDISVVPQNDLFTVEKQEDFSNNLFENKDVINQDNPVVEMVDNPKEQISDLMPLEKITEIDYSNDSNVSNVNESLNDKIEISNDVVLPEFQFNQNSNLDIQNENKNDNNVFVAPNPSILGNNINDTITYSNTNNSFDVDSGINVDLEKEIMKSNIENQFKPDIVNNSNVSINDSEEKVVYRAKRNNPQVINNFYDNKEVESIKKDYNLDTTSYTSNLVVENDNSDLFPTPNVINIDDEIERENSLGNIDLKELMTEEIDSSIPAVKSNLLEELSEKEKATGKLSILARYGDDFCSRDYVTNPAIGREEEINQLILILLTPEKSGILVGKPGIGKTSIVEGLAYRLQRNKVPEALKGYRIVSVKTTSLLGTLTTGETRLQTLIDELKNLDKIILFVDEIHMLMGATTESSLDFANMFKESLGRGSIKMIGATTTDEYEKYVLRDKAFVRRFQRVDVEEPSREHTIKILMGTLPKIEKNTGARLKYSDYIKSEIMAFIVDITTEYKRIYGIGSRYPDICLTLLSQAFSQAVFDNRSEVNILDIRNAIENSKNIYPDVIRKELVNFDNKFKKIIDEENNY